MQKIKNAAAFALLVLAMAAELFLPEIRERGKETDCHIAALLAMTEEEDGLPRQSADCRGNVTVWWWFE